jgi:hypothetical protein
VLITPRGYRVGERPGRDVGRTGERRHTGPINPV